MGDGVGASSPPSSSKEPQILGARHWMSPDPWTAPTILAVRQLALKYQETGVWHLDMFLDIHAHSTTMNGFLFCNVQDDPEKFELEAAFPRLLGNNAKDFAFSGSKFCRDPAKAGTGRRALSEVFVGTHCYTLEVSFFCSANGNMKGPAYSQDSYMDLGRRVGLTLHDFYTIPASGNPAGGAFMCGQRARERRSSASAQPPSSQSSHAPTRSDARSGGAGSGAAASVCGATTTSNHRDRESCQMATNRRQAPM